MSYLIDTDTIIYSIKGNSIVLKNFEKHISIPKQVSVITYGELLFGAHKSKFVEKNLAIAQRIREIFPIIEVDTAIVETLARLKAGLQKSGSSLDDMDLLIAATALTNNLTLVSNNIKHFQKIPGLRLENWTKD